LEEPREASKEIVVKDSEVLYSCFEQVADSGEDIAPAIYGKFFQAMPEAEQHISIMDERMRGRMVEQIYSLLLGEADTDYLKFEADMHRGYGANTAFYRGILEAVKDTVRDRLEDQWSGEFEGAWDRSIERITGEIEQFNSADGGV
jgi:hemoglobin-like flavoprotein